MMSPELLEAAKEGNLAAVQQILSNPDVNINYVGQVWGFTYQVTALTVAIASSHADIALFLIEKGAAIENADLLFRVGSYNNYGRSVEEDYPSSLALTCDYAGPVRTDLFKTLLRKTRDLAPIIARAKNDFKAGERSHRSYNIYYQLYEDRCLALLLHEILLRGEKEVSLLVSNRPSDKNIFNLITPATMASYLEDRSLSLDQIAQARHGIDALAKLKLINANAANNLRLIIDASEELILEEIIPSSVHEILNEEPDKNLDQLFAELQYWLFPDESLPASSTKCSAYKRFIHDTGEKTLEEIESWQNPVELKKFLSLEKNQIMVRLLASSLEIEKNPAALLLSIILKHYKTSKVMVNDQEEPLLIFIEERKLLHILKDFFTKSPLEEVLFLKLQAQEQRRLEMQSKIDDIERDSAEEKKINLELKSKIDDIKRESAEEKKILKNEILIQNKINNAISAKVDLLESELAYIKQSLLGLNAPGADKKAEAPRRPFLK